MVLPGNLQLPVLPIGTQTFANNPDPHMIAARSKHPWLAASDFGFVITDYDACDEILRMDARLKTPAEHIVQIMGGTGSNWARFQFECLIARDGVDHDRVRDAVRNAFSPRAVATYKEQIRSVITDLLDEWAPSGAFDFESFASHFPVAVMFGLVGIPRSHIAAVKELLEAVGQSFSLDASLFPAISNSFDQLWEIVDQLVAARVSGERSRSPDLLDALILAQTEGSISELELRDLILFLFVAGYDTSKNQLSHIMNLLLDRPDMWQRCAAERNYCAQVVNEALRYCGVATSYRNVIAGFEYRGVHIDAGTMLIFPLGIVCRYSGPFENAGEFDPERPNAPRHTAFSRGMHMCLGQFLARLQIAEGLHLIARRLRNPRRNGAVEWRLFPGVWGPRRLPIAFESADVGITAAEGHSLCH
jgi:cytochrome P450